jgi:hypothetical protein
VATTRSPARDRVLVLLSMKAGLRATAMASLTWARVTDAPGQVAEGLHVPHRASKGKTGGRTILLLPTASPAGRAKLERPHQHKRGVREYRGTGGCWTGGYHILKNLNKYRHPQERRMRRRMGIFVLGTFLGSLSLPSLAVANDAAVGRYSVYPRVVGTVVTLEPRGLATIQTSDGARYAVIRGTGWRVGDTVTCEHAASERPSRQAWQGMRSGCQNITLAITPSDGIPCRHGYAPLITPGTLGTDSTGNPSPH